MEQCPYDIIPHVAVHPSQINLYSTIEWHGKKPFRPKTDHLIKSDKKTNGKVSSQASRKISRAIDYLLFMASDKNCPSKIHGKNFKFKISFITLTLPSAQIHSDNEIKEKCLNQFFVEARKRWHVINYLWRAEKQKNGSIHFHILCDRFIPWSELRDVWNRIVNKLGYVERYRTAMRDFHSGGFACRKELLKHWSYENQLKAYQKGKANDWASPNSTDIHSIKKVTDVRKYVLKYTSKDDPNGSIEGRIWGCNFELSNIKGGVEVAYSSISNEINIISQSGRFRIYKADYFTVMDVKADELLELGCNQLFKIFSDYLVQRFSFNYQLKT